MQIKDQNGNIVRRDIRKECAQWGVNVWFGGVNGLATSLRRYYYGTRQQARCASIGDVVGQNGRRARGV